MRRSSLPIFFLAGFCVSLVFSPSGFSGQVVSSMRNVNAVMEARGYRLQPAPDVQTPYYPGDHAPAQAFELIRPRGEAIRIGRLYTSCSCVRLETSKNNFAQNERAIFILRNVIPTPENGQMYAMYVQVTRPLRTTLRIDTFFQSAIYAPIPDAPLVTEDALEKDIPLIIPSLEKKEEEPVAEPVETASGDDGREQAMRKTGELKVTDVTDPSAPSEAAEQDGDFEPVDDQKVDDYVSRFLETQNDEATKTDKTSLSAGNGEKPAESDSNPENVGE